MKLGEEELAKARRLWQQGRLEEAERAYRRLARQFPRLIDAQYFLGTFLAETGRCAEGIEVLQRAERLAPDSPWIKINLGTAFQLLGDEAGALACFSAAAQLGYSSPELLSNLGLLHIRAGRFAAALATLSELTSRWPQFAPGHSSLARVLGLVGRVDEAAAAAERALALVPDDPRLISSWLFTNLYRDGVDGAAVRELHERWAPRLVTTAGPSFAPAVSRDGSLTLGFVSPDLGDHSVAYFLRPLVDELDPSRFRSIFYACTRHQDEVTQALQRRAAAWRDISQLDDSAARRVIAADGVDVLIDLAGHTVNNRLGLFAVRSAALQLSCIGYPATTGLPTMDYVLTDATLDPPGSEAHYVERLHRLDYFCAYRPPEDAPPIGPAPCLRNGPLTLGAFHAGQRLTPTNLARWSAVLAGLPEAKLLLMARGVGDDALRNPILAALAQAGVAPERIELREFGPLDQFLAALGEVDIALDATPWNGHTTTCHALWMGVPTLTWPGGRRAGRMGLALMQEVGLREFAVADLAEALLVVRQFAADSSRLAGVRSSLRERMRTSRLLDGAAFARNFERCLCELAGCQVA